MAAVSVKRSILLCKTLLINICKLIGLYKILNHYWYYYFYWTGVRLNKPYSVRVPMDIPVFTGTHADFLIIVSTAVPTVQLHVLIKTDVDRTWLGNLSSISTVMATIRKIF